MRGPAERGGETSLALRTHPEKSDPCPGGWTSAAKVLSCETQGDGWRKGLIFTDPQKLQQFIANKEDKGQQRNAQAAGDGDAEEEMEAVE
ncbi:hypothetical protein NDU88_000931 [Pleurodeles waltl]|uniref:Uncharacterized protein n=1 Tax=Pleurodeles waltl TaxID=8319 RepID=A0AAV7VXZ5_PLEWA|nr:hypothetical protein NDU88_000931 [Pleurodeles waltl]